MGFLPRILCHLKAKDLYIKGIYSSNDRQVLQGPPGFCKQGIAEKSVQDPSEMTFKCFNLAPHFRE